MVARETCQQFADPHTALVPFVSQARSCRSGSATARCTGAKHAQPAARSKKEGSRCEGTLQGVSVCMGVRPVILKCPNLHLHVAAEKTYERGSCGLAWLGISRIFFKLNGMFFAKLHKLRQSNQYN